MAAVVIVKRLNIRPAAARSVVGSKRGRFEPSTAAKPSENRGRMPMTPGADPERPVASIVGAHCRISTQRMSHPVHRVQTRFSRFANRANIFVSWSLRIRIVSAETPCCLQPLYFTLPSHFGRSTASTLPSPIGPLPKSSSRALAVAIPLQGKDTAIPLPNPMIPQGTTTKSLGGLASCPV